MRPPVELWNALEPDDDLRRGRGQRLPGTHEDRDAGPPPVLDLEPESDERLRVGVRPHALDVLVAPVLTADARAGSPPASRGTRRASSRDRVVVARRRLHRNEREHLQEVVLHDVADRADRVVEAAPLLDAEVLGHGDLDRLDVLAVPERLEEGVREAQVHDVLDRLLAQEVVDPEEALLREDRGQTLVQLARGCEIGAEGLLDDEPAPIVDETRSRELIGDLEERRGWRGEVEDGRVGVAESTRSRS